MSPGAGYICYLQFKYCLDDIRTRHDVGQEPGPERAAHGFRAGVGGTDADDVLAAAEHVHRCDNKGEAIKSVMREARAVASPDDTLPELLAKIRRFRVNAIPVVRDDKLVGLITNSSIVTTLSQQSIELEEVEEG